MTCHHSPGDRSCGTQYPRYEAPPPTPDASNYQITEAHREGPHLVLKVRYPNCSNCSYEGTKVMVFLSVTEVEALRWRKINPHFRSHKSMAAEAPSPAARFPGSPEGWQDALNYARSKAGVNR